MIFLDVHIESVQVGSRIRLRPLPGPGEDPFQRCKTDSGIIVPVPRYWISGNKAIRLQYPVGTVFIADLMLIKPDRSGNYLKVRTGHQLEFPYMQHVKVSKHGQLKII